MPCIYKITNPTNDIYIGQTINLKKRISRHKSSAKKRKTPLNRSVDFYGMENHSIEILHELPIDANTSIMDIYEMLYIELYKTCGFNLMNMTNGGRGFEFTEYVRQRMSESQKGPRNHQFGKIINEKAKLALLKSRLGKPHSEETKIKMSMANKGKPRKGTPHTQEWKDNMSKRMKEPNSYSFLYKKPPLRERGFKHKPESIAKMVAKITGQKRTAETKLKMSETAKRQSAETKLKKSIGAKRRWALYRETKNKF